MMSSESKVQTGGLQPARLDEEEIACIRRLEADLGDRVCLLAVEKQPLFVLEAKVGPNAWQNIQEVYPDLHLGGTYLEREEAHLVKASLKTLLLGAWKGRLKKRPVRIREVV
ncbi:MAG: hypothetical protein PVG49_08120 [Desulfobacteraceae bacterium]|jgi:hypothetical protein